MVTYEHARPALTVDVAVVAGPPTARFILLVRRALEPFAGAWALPGGFVEEGERLADAALRELAEETGIEITGDVLLVDVGAFGDPGRDPRGWTVSAVFGLLLGETLPDVAAGDDAQHAEWHPLDALPHLAFDHDAIVVAARERLGV